MNTPLEQASLELDELIHDLHHAGLTYWEILGEFFRKLECLYIQAQAEYYSKGGK